MRYLGGKSKLSKDIVPFIQKYYDSKSHKYYIEPFCGSIAIGKNVVSDKKIFSDIHKPLIEMWKALNNGWIPPEQMNKDQYSNMKLYPNLYENYLLGFVGFQCSFGGLYFQGYAKDNTNRNYCKEGKNGLLKDINLIKQNTKNKLIFYNCDFKRFINYRNCFFYFDPPYFQTRIYNQVNNFDYNFFSSVFLPKLKSNGNTIIISEYKQNIDLFPDSKLLWEKEIKIGLSKQNNKRTECLLLY